jgi:alpha-1,3-mannosyltransferase
MKLKGLNWDGEKKIHWQLAKLDKVQSLTIWGVLAALSCAAIFQVIVGMPFLAAYPTEYLSRAFNLGRVFIHFWSVNFKFVHEEVFVSKPFAITLLVVHLGLLFLFAQYKWCKYEQCFLTPPFSCP